VLDWAETRPDAMQATVKILAIIGFCSRVFRHIDRDKASL